LHTHYLILFNFGIAAVERPLVGERKRKDPRDRGVTATRQLLLPKLTLLFENNLLCFRLFLILNCIINKYG